MYAFKVVAKYRGDTMAIKDDLQDGKIRSRIGISYEYQANLQIKSSKPNNPKSNDLDNRIFIILGGL